MSTEKNDNKENDQTQNKMGETIQKDVKEYIVEQNASIRKAVVEQLAESEVNTRKDLIVKAVRKIEALNDDHKKIKAKEFFGEDGEVARKEFTAEDNKKRNDIVKHIDDIEKALGQALVNDNPNYDKLKGLDKKNKI